MDIEQKIAELQQSRQNIEKLLNDQQIRMRSFFSADLEQQFWKDREDRITRLVVRAFVPATIIYFLFELISLPLNYFNTEPQYRYHDVGLTMISYTTGWIALFLIYLMSRREEWKRHYRVVVSIVICMGLAVVQSVLLSMQSVSMTWRGTLIIVFALMFAYLCSGLRPRYIFTVGMISSLLTLCYLKMFSNHVPGWVLSNVMLLGNLVGLGLSLLTISTERIRFLQAIIIRLDHQIHEILNLHLFTLSQQDALTSLTNRRGFEYHFNILYENAQTQNRSLALLFIDVDFFKRYNDAYGHQNGDIALIRVAQALKRHLSDKDIAARYGGEEFLLLLADAGEVRALEIAESILKDIREQNIPHSDSDVCSILTLSIGVAVYSGEIERSQEEVLKHADNALYRAKHQGRNQVVYQSDAQ